MNINWYPANKIELEEMLNDFLKTKQKFPKELHGLIVPHAGYQFSGEISGKAYSLLKGKKFEKVIILGPSHYKGFKGIKSLKEILTPLGRIKIVKNDYEKLDYEHSVQNQIPFIQKMLPNAKILPLVVGQINMDFAETIAKELVKEKALFVISTDLSHFMPYKQATEKDKATIKIIEKLNFKALQDIDACGIFPLMIGMQMCKQKSYKPKLIEYKNSGDVTEDKSSVVGYASFWF